MEYVSLEGLRLDGRRAKETRRIRCATTVLPDADGSASFEAGNTKVVAAVFGPREAPSRGDALHDRATVRVTFSAASFSASGGGGGGGGDARVPRGGRRGDRRSLELSLVITRALETAIVTELMPRSAVDVTIQVLQADGSVRAAAINAAVLALADAGVPLRDTMAACTAGFLDGHALLDVNADEERAGGPEVHAALLPNLDKVVVLQLDNKCAMDAFGLAHELALDGCRVVGREMREAMIARTKHLAATRAHEAL